MAEQVAAEQFPMTPLLLVAPAAKVNVEECLNNFHERPLNRNEQLFCDGLQAAGEDFINQLCEQHVIAASKKNELLEMLKSDATNTTKTILSIVHRDEDNISLNLRKLVYLLMQFDRKKIDGFATLADKLDPWYSGHYRKLVSERLSDNSSWKPTVFVSHKDRSKKYAHLHPLDDQYPLPSKSVWPDMTQNDARNLCDLYYLEPTTPEVLDQIKRTRAYDTTRQGTMVKHNGLCFIVNIQNYIGNQQKDRSGSEKDVEAIRCLFEKKFRMRVEEKLNYTDANLVDFLENLDESAQSYGDTILSYLVMFIMCHGSDDFFSMTNSGKLSFEKDIKQRINNLKLFQNKPKIVFIQACRGSAKNGNDGDCDASPSEEGEQPHKELPKEAEQQSAATSTQSQEVNESWQKRDMYVFMATTTGYAAKRYSDWGTPFIQSVLQVLKCRAHFKPMDELKIEVRRLMERFADSRYQFPPVIDTLQRPFYFYCPLHIDVTDL